MDRVARSPTYRRASLKERAAAAVVAVFVSSMTLGTVMALYSSPDSDVLTARVEESEGGGEAIGPRSQIPARPCVTKPWLCA